MGLDCGGEGGAQEIPLVKPCSEIPLILEPPSLVVSLPL